MRVPVYVEVKKQPDPGLYRMTAGMGPEQITAMCELKGGGWRLTGYCEAGPYAKLSQAREVFTAFAQACVDAGGYRTQAGRRAGQRAIRVLDPRAPLPEPLSPDPMLTMAPGFVEPPDLADIRASVYLDEPMALVLIRRHRTQVTLYGDDPDWHADRRHLIEQGYGPLMRMTDHERTEVYCHIHA